MDATQEVALRSNSATLMNATLGPSLVRIKNANGAILGAGFLVSETHVITCAHVVSQALGLQYTPDSSPKDEVHIDFPFLKGARRVANIENWKPIATDGSGDIAVLNLKDKPPADAYAAPLLSGSQLVGRRVEVYGFPEGNDTGAYAYGVLGKMRANKSVQIEDTKTEGLRIQPGFSGAPVWDMEACGVVGMVVTAESDPSAKVAFMLPEQLLSEARSDSWLPPIPLTTSETTSDALPETGITDGHIYQSIAYFKNTVVAWYMAKMLHSHTEEDSVGRNRILRIRCEASEPVGDIVIEFEHGNRYIQVKETLTSTGEAWGKLWQHIWEQQPSLRSEADRMVLWGSPKASLFGDLKAMTQCAANVQPGARFNQYTEFANRLNDEHSKLLHDKIVPVLKAKIDSSLTSRDAFDLLRLIDIVVLGDAELVAQHAKGAFLTPYPKSEALFNEFRDLASKRGSVGGIIVPGDLRHIIERGRTGFPTNGNVTSDTDSYYFVIQQEIIKANTQRYLPRTGVEEAFADFLTTHNRGYFVVISGPGFGKTAFAAHLIEKHGYIHHFITQEGGRADARLILLSLLSQFNAPVDASRSIDELVRQLEMVLVQRSQRGETTVIVIDGLDELSSENSSNIPFLIINGLPERVFFLTTTRPSEQLETLSDSTGRLDVMMCPLLPLLPTETESFLRTYLPHLSSGIVSRITTASDGNPLYLQAVIEAFHRDPGFDLSNLPEGVVGFYRRDTRALKTDTIRREAIGVLAVARDRLSSAELALILGQSLRTIENEVLARLSFYLTEIDGRYALYHKHFRDFVLESLLYKDELPGYHERIARWLTLPASRSAPYRIQSLTYHLVNAGEVRSVIEMVNHDFLLEKTRRYGYGVLEDLELLTQVIVAQEDATLIEHCVLLLENLRAVVGDKVLTDTRQAVHAFGWSGNDSSNSTTQITQPLSLPTIRDIDIFGATIPKGEVGADFIVTVPLHDHVVVAVGDAPGSGLKSAFVARFLANIFRRRVEQAPNLKLPEIIKSLDVLLSTNPFFDPVTLLCMDIEPGQGTVAIINSGHPYPLLFSRRRGLSDQLPVHGLLLGTSTQGQNTTTSLFPVRFEMEVGDILVSFTDGFMEDKRNSTYKGDHDMKTIVKELVNSDAATIGEALLYNWRLRQKGTAMRHNDDASVVVIKRTMLNNGKVGL